MKALDYVINYMYDDELKSYAEFLTDRGIDGDPVEFAKRRSDNHVFCAIARLMDDPDAEFVNDNTICEALNKYMANKIVGDVEFSPVSLNVYEALLPNPVPGLVKFLKLRAIVHHGLVDLRFAVPNTETCIASFELEDYL